jgi:hypothetical protein
MPTRNVDLTSRKRHNFEGVETMEEAGNEVFLSHERVPPENDAEADRVQHVAEKVFSISLLLLGIVLDLLPLTPHNRPIPVQILQDGYVVNQTYNEILDGDTVSGSSTLYETQMLIFQAFCFSLVVLIM